ncbi:Lipid transfer protein or keto acyl-CoA thiolase Ltp4 [Amycolatopsis camponoti]|uniref:Lipid transfer protein or keto acyl-CoA thiolase Ltp4 n=1 Tax=Amycolatopsis camponoti TaxID=2606593 RepID=A0A6I8LHJ8_9PSEU|nr:thiolase domain-containing protein [Amycolatopsis camponoti]VVJ16974.1 Lipid transfer protein or keto acyl-CoA thiolase Ltp4 [Amycolatopsis camponoti]
MPDVAIAGFAKAPNVRETAGTTNGVEMLVPIFAEVFEKTGLSKQDIGFWCSGSSDYLAGRAFSFIAAVDAIGAFPPIHESHVEMDAAWALYEAWLKIKMGEVETALVYGFGKSSAGQLRRVLALQLDPYVVAPLWPDSVSIAGIQARLGLDAGLWSEKDLAEVAARGTDQDVSALLDTPYFADPLRKHDIAPVTDGAAVVVLSTVERAKDIVEHPAVIQGIEHRVDSPVLGARDLTRSPSTEIAARALDLDGVDLAELHAPFTHQELILRTALKLDDTVKVNPSGGALAANPMFSAGLARIGEAATRIHTGESRKAVAHATSGPALQQNLVTVLEAR